MGTTIAYGVVGILFLRKNTNWKTFIAGMLMLTLLSFIIAPFSLQFLASVLVGGSSLTKKPNVSLGDPNITSIIITGIMYLGGFFFTLLLSLLYYAIYIVGLVAQHFLSGSQEITTTQPGGTFLLPGINLPLLEGVLALAAILIIHEGFHAVLSRIAGVKLLSSGLVFFGIIPVGAFVEPDENMLKETPAKEQTRVLIAGVAGNFIASVVFFLLFLPIAFYMKTLSPGAAYSIVHFFYLFLGLAFSLNFIVGTVNLLPMPMFDGYRILEINIPHKKLVTALMYLTLIAFLMNFVPWIFIR
jgi:Zn-dependent protease